MSITIPTEDNSQLRYPPRCNTSWSPETPPPRKPSSARIPRDYSSLLKYLGEDDLVLRSVTITTFLSLKPLLTNRRYDYHPTSRTLRVCSMARPVHSSVEQFVSEMFGDMQYDRWFLDSEKKLVRTASLPVMLPTCRYRDRKGKKGTKMAAWSKTPDAAFIVGPTGGKLKMAIVFEVGFSEVYEDLKRDAQQWLIKGNSFGVNMVVLFLIEEDTAGRYKRLQEIEHNGILKTLMDEFSNSLGKIRFGVDNKDDGDTEEDEDEDDDSNSIPGSVCSDGIMYEQIANTIVVSDWVSSITNARMEFWRANPETGSPFCECSFPIIPVPEIPHSPAVIKITDLFPDANPQRPGWEIDLDIYRKYLTAGINDLAVVRAIARLRPRHNDHEGNTSFRTEDSGSIKSDD
ncbi:hypothetical protein BDD12DRAFT_859325 [Trichophaea hybrida]|nr:hypothetical protein BDD12DRAFT_859325 [Trichophaea hybrida]